MTVFIGGAWPYANGSLHLGHIAGLLPGDIIARYYRLKGKQVLYVSGSDCNGTPIGIRARQVGVMVEDIADRYHEEFTHCFQSMGFSYDEYTRTDHPQHHEEVQRIFTLLYENGWLYEKEIEQVYCVHDQRFLPDRFVEGTCPVCGSKARGDQCDQCSTVLDPTDLLDKCCNLCGHKPVLKTTTHLYFALSKFQQPLQTLLNEHKGKWRENAVQLTSRYLEEGLKDRPVSRDLENGVEVPLEGFRDKMIYVWIEAVCGYLSASKKWAGEANDHWNEYWDKDTVSYYVHGKDNIPFHTIIWPAILMGMNEEMKLPDHIVSNEYLTLEKRKISTSQNWAVWLKDLLTDYHPDTIRYFLTINAPEKRDADFSWREFIYSHNSELLGAFGNLVQRTVKFYKKEFGDNLIVTSVDEIVERRVEEVFTSVGKWIEAGSTRQGLEEVFEFIRWSNKRFDEKKPWVIMKENRGDGRKVLEEFIYIIGNLRSILEPFLPFTASKVGEQLGMTQQPVWGNACLPLKLTIENTLPLFTRIELESIDKEREKLIEKSNVKGE